MTYEKFALNFTLIDQIVYEIITNQFTPLPVAATITHFWASNLSLKVITNSQVLQFSFNYNFFLLTLKICLLKKNCLYT